LFECTELVINSVALIAGKIEHDEDLFELPKERQRNK